MTSTFKWLAAVALAVLFSGPALAAGTTPLGHWQVTTGEARYTVTSCGGGGALCAKLVWLRTDARTEENLALLNKYVVKGAVPAAVGKWQGNVTFSGHSYDGTMTMVSKNFMTLKGCSGMLCQTYEFTRI
jgi:uncharacterized protein (DUF2147 family)